MIISALYLESVKLRGTPSQARRRDAVETGTGYRCLQPLVGVVLSNCECSTYPEEPGDTAGSTNRWLFWQLAYSIPNPLQCQVLLLTLATIIYVTRCTVKAVEINPS